MKKVLFSVFGFAVIILAAGNAKAQTMKIGVFDIDVMVQAMPGYHIVDSLLQIYETDSLGGELQYNQSEYHRLDSTYKADSALAAAGKKSKTLVDMVAADRKKVALNLVYWQQIAQNKSNNKRSQLAQPLYNAVAEAFKKILARKKYTLILKPQTYEAGFAIDNIFISVARELKLTELPQDLLYLGDDPDPVKQPTQKQPATNKPKN
jgi:Skp family chaperone for outer membrane proteins